MMVLALLIIVAQGGIVALLLYFVRTFGQFTDVLRRVHDENLILRQYLARSTRPPVDIHEGLPEEEVA